MMASRTIEALVEAAQIGRFALGPLMFTVGLYGFIYVCEKSTVISANTGGLYVIGGIFVMLIGIYLTITGLKFL
jgi:hypothetical membrane protein